MGPSIFVYGPDMLIDKLVEIKLEPVRAAVGEIPSCIHAHWHSGHATVRPVFDDNIDWRRRPQQNRPTGVYIPCQIAADLRTSLGTWDLLKFLDHGGSGVIRLIQPAEGETVPFGGYEDRALPAGEERHPRLRVRGSWQARRES